jgi:N-methylhydantoinase A
MVRAMADDTEQPRIAVDIGGTFTDVVLEQAGRLATAKVLTTPDAPEEGALAGIEAVLGETGTAPGAVALVIHGTTLATNAIIERNGAVTALVTTEGFRDVVEIGYESRYDQYDVMIEKPVPLVPRVRRLTVPERVDVHGRVLRPLDEDAVTALIPRIEALDAASVAVGFLHAYANPAHEQRVRDILQAALPGLSISISSEVCPEVREYERLTTTTANAYIRPVMDRYLGRMRERLDEFGCRCPVLLMTSGGGLMALDTARRFPIRLVESGPAGGAILAGQVAAEAGLDKVISFDMGGTTAKICLIDGFEPRKARAFEVDRAARFLKGSGLPLRIPVIEMVEIGAGGGSIARLDPLKRVTIGPDSAGADPGPAAYDHGGARPTVTDADIALGRIDPERFAGGKIRLSPAKAADAIQRDIGSPLGLDPGMAAYGITEMVDETMANAARVHAVEQGQAAAEHALVAFGGAAPLHVARLAEKLGIDRIVVPTNAGVGSAIGFLRAPVAYEVVRSRNMRLRQFDPDAVNTILADMQAEALAVVRAGAPDAPVVEQRMAYMRYVGQGHEIVVPLPDRALTADDTATLQAAFDAVYETLYRRTIPNAEVEILTWALTVSTAAPPPASLAGAPHREPPQPVSARPMYDPEQDRSVDVPLYARADLAPGMRIAGPAVIAEDATSTYLTAAFDVRVAANGYLFLERKKAPSP